MTYSPANNEDFFTDAVLYTLITDGNDTLEGVYTSKKDHNEINDFCFRVVEPANKSSLKYDFGNEYEIGKIYSGYLKFEWVGSSGAGPLDDVQVSKAWKLYVNNVGKGRIGLKDIIVRDSTKEANLKDFENCLALISPTSTVNASVGLFGNFGNNVSKSDQNKQKNGSKIISWQTIDASDRIAAARALKQIGYMQDNEGKVVPNYSKIEQYKSDFAKLQGVQDLPPSIGKIMEYLFPKTGGRKVTKPKVKVLGRERVVKKEGKKSYVTYKGKLLGLKEARALEKELARLKVK
jgi:hypothetical protein